MLSPHPPGVSVLDLHESAIPHLAACPVPGRTASLSSTLASRHWLVLRCSVRRSSPKKQVIMLLCKRGSAKEIVERHFSHPQNREEEG